MEGVMIRSPERISTALRRADGSILVRTRPYTSLPKRRKWLDIPIVRGAVSFVEMLSLGLDALNFSAEIAAQDEPGDDGKPVDPHSFGNRLIMWGTMAFALAAGFGLFMFLPLAIADLVVAKQNAFSYNMVAGAVRVVVFLGYLWSITRLKDIQRVFAYHGAEHQTIYAYEAGEELEASNAAGHSRFHPRCGTSFLLIVVLLAILAYAVIDSGFYHLVGRPPVLWERFSVHMAFLPFVAGLSFEALKLTGVYRKSRLVQALAAPGLWLQNLTTRPPDDDMLAVAVVAARASLGLETPDAVEYVPDTPESARAV